MRLCIYCHKYCQSGFAHDQCRRSAPVLGDYDRLNIPGDIDLVEESRTKDREAAEAGDNAAQLRQAARRSARSQGRTRA